MESSQSILGGLSEDFKRIFFFSPEYFRVQRAWCFSSDIFEVGRRVVLYSAARPVLENGDEEGRLLR